MKINLLPGETYIGLLKSDKYPFNQYHLILTPSDTEYVESYLIGSERPLTLTDSDGTYRYDYRIPTIKELTLMMETYPEQFQENMQYWSCTKWAYNGMWSRSLFGVGYDESIKGKEYMVRKVRTVDVES